MITLCRELMKIVRQLHGSENIFGYKSTVANQLYLFYCFSGKIYFTDKVHQQVKFLWYGIISSQVLFSFVIGFTYLWYGAAENDPVVMLNLANAIGSLHFAAIGIPSILYFYRDSIETMIDRVDGILSKQGISEQKKVEIGAKKTFLAVFNFNIALLTILYLICFLDVVLLFEESKVKNYQYYLCPVFILEKYHTIGWFFFIYGLSTGFMSLLAVETYLVLSIVSYWGTVWYTELISLCDELNSGMRDLGVYFENRGSCSNDWNETFECNLKRSIKRFQKATILIDDLRGFVGIYGTGIIYMAYCYNLFFLYHSFTGNISMVLMAKNILASMGCITTISGFYWTGQKLENSVSEVRMAIYSTPWYCSVKVRKNAYIFMCQTESVKSFTILKVYGLLLNGFARYMHTLVSHTNMLRRLTRK